MSSTVIETATLYPCSIPRDKLLEIARTCEDFQPERGDRGIEEALDDLRWMWERDHRETPISECPIPHVALLGGVLYEVKGFESSEEMDFHRVTERPDGGLDLVAIYYNGGASWTEVAEEALAWHKAEKKEE